MPLYEFACECGLEFERLIPRWSDANPSCGYCGAQTARRPGAVSLGGSARPPSNDARMPRSWRGTKNGDSGYVGHWRGVLERRQSFEEKHPEHAKPRAAVAAHEGSFHGNPLTYQELGARMATTNDRSEALQHAAASRAIAQTSIET